jgi:hypothetical protein
MVGAEVVVPGGLITEASLAEAIQRRLEREGIDGTLLALERLMRRGFEVAKASGASMSPFIGEGLRRPPEPRADDADLWAAYREELTEKLVSMTDYTDAEIGPQLLAVSIRARGQQHLPALIGPKVGVMDARDEPVVVPHGYTEGLTSGEMLACAASARRGLARWRIRWEQMGQEIRDARHEPVRFTVLARARRAQRPGIVFARAAATGEVDPLADVDSRLLMGLPIAES